MTYYDNSKLEDAANYLLKTISMKNEMENVCLKLDIYFMICTIYLKQEKYKEIQEYLNKELTEDKLHTILNLDKEIPKIISNYELNGQLEKVVDLLHNYLEIKIPYTLRKNVNDSFEKIQSIYEK